MLAAMMHRQVPRLQVHSMGLGHSVVDAQATSQAVAMLLQVPYLVLGERTAQVGGGPLTLFFYLLISFTHFALFPYPWQPVGQSCGETSTLSSLTHSQYRTDGSVTDYQPKWRLRLGHELVFCHEQHLAHLISLTSVLRN